MINALFSLATELNIRYRGSQRRALLRFSKSEEAQISRFEKELENGLFSYRVITGTISEKSKIHFPFVVNVGSEYGLIKYVNGVYYDSKGAISLEKYIGCRFFELREVVKKTSPEELLSQIIRFTPLLSAWLLLLTPVALVTPLYTNIFNTRIIYSNSITTLFIVAMFFFGIYLLDFFCKKVIKIKCMKLNTTSSLMFERYILKFTPYFRSFSGVNSARTIEQYRKMIWDSIPIIASDTMTFIILFITMSIFIQWLIVYFLLFYFIVFMVFYLYRSRLYQHLIEKENASADVLKKRFSNLNNKEHIPFINRFLFFRQYLNKYNASQYYDDKISHFNFYWDELTKMISFIALTMLFAVTFVGVSSGNLNPAYMIVLFIVNSRLAGLASQITTRLSYYKMSLVHIKQSAESMLDSEQVAELIDDTGVMLEDVNQIKISDLSIVHDKTTLLENVNLKLNKGIIYGIKGAVGSGKSTFVKTLIGLNKDFQGKIEYDGVNINTIDSNFFETNICFLNAEATVFSGSLFENFLLHNCANNRAIEYILKECFGNRVFDYPTLYIADIDQIPMSTGQRKKLLFLMTISNRANVYVLDEALVNLSHSDILKSLNLIRQYAPNAIFLLTSHNDSILAACDIILEVKQKNILQLIDPKT